MSNYYKVLAQFRGKSYKIVIRKGKLDYAEPGDFLEETPFNNLPVDEQLLYDGMFSHFENAAVIAAVATQQFKLVDAKVETW